MVEKIKIYGFEMSRISEVYLSTLSSFMAPQGLERYFFPLIFLSEHNGEFSQNKLAEIIRRDKVFTMRIVDYLSDKGFLKRTQDSSDRRCHLLTVTEKGKAMVPKIKEGIAKTDELLFHNFSAEEKEQFKNSMSKLYATINTLPEPEFIVKAFKIKKSK